MAGMKSPAIPMAELSDCVVCPHECRADRFRKSTGFCRSGAGFSIASVCVHRGEEPAISGPDGIVNLFFTGCNLRCVYCQNHQISDHRSDHSYAEMGLEEVVRRILHWAEQGYRRVGFVSPSHVVPQVAAIIAGVESRGVKPVWVYNTNAYDKAETLRKLEGVIDVYLPDFKYIDHRLGSRYSLVDDYPEQAKKALKEMFRQKGSTLAREEDGTAFSGMIIRHLVLPGQVNNSLEVLRWIAGELSPDVHVSLMSQYYPTRRVDGHPELGRSIAEEEYRLVTREMERLGMTRGWIQEFESNAFYRPDFDRDHPFESCAE